MRGPVPNRRKPTGTGPEGVSNPVPGVFGPTSRGTLGRLLLRDGWGLVLRGVVRRVGKVEAGEGGRHGTSFSVLPGPKFLSDSK